MIELLTLISGIIAFISLLREIKHKKIIFWSLTLALVVLDGLRWEMGGDWISYYTYFGLATDINVYPGFELGFRFYTYLIRSITDNYSVYLLITTAFIYIGIFYTVFTITNYSFIALFYLTGTLPWYSGSLRQMMATVFFVMALKAVMDEKIKRFMLFILIGLMFHITILVFLPMYWLYGMSSGIFLLLFVILSILSVFSENLVHILDDIVRVFSFEKNFSSRIGGTLALSHPLLGFSRKILTIVGFVVFSVTAKSSPSVNRTQWKKIRFMLRLVFFSVIFYYIGTYHVNFVSSRLDIYVSIISASVLIGLLDKSFEKRENRILLYFFVVALVCVFYYRLEWMDLFHPYSSIFYNMDLHRKLH